MFQILTLNALNKARDLHGYPRILAAKISLTEGNKKQGEKID